MRSSSVDTEGTAPGHWSTATFLVAKISFYLIFSKCGCSFLLLSCSSSGGSSAGGMEPRVGDGQEVAWERMFLSSIFSLQSWEVPEMFSIWTAHVCI